ncbi:putative Transcription factor jumonji [[Clostridium] ultunense Esp]|nr:putative Transcription factor jumonji [[Clostridium] ultunense Esp]
MENVIEINRWDSLSFLNITRPIVVRNGTRDWPISSLLNTRNLKTIYGDSLVKAVKQGSDEIRLFYIKDFVEYMERCDESNPWYITNWMFRDQFPELANGILLPKVLSSWFDFLPKEIELNWLWMFIGPTGSFTPLHIDVMMSSAWNALFSGTKKWRFLSPKLSIHSGLVPKELTQEFTNEEYEFTCIQHPGDVLITPSGWAHEVINEGNTIAVTGNFVNETNVNIVEKFIQTKGSYAWAKVVRHLKQKINDGYLI